MDNLTGKQNTDNKIIPEIIQSEEKEINYWRSFSELYSNPGFAEAKTNEFSPSVTEDFNSNNLSAISRRKFLALLGASAAFAAAGCANYRDKGEIIPYNNKPEEILQGVPNYYASTCNACMNSCGILIKTREGRPVKIDGNPDHPVSQGKICVKGQANILNLYDPVRMREPMFSPDRNNFGKVEWIEADDKIIRELKSASTSGKEIAVITHSVISPSQKKLFEDFIQAYPTAKIYSYELADDSAKRSAWMKCYGKTSLPVIMWENAKVILALESDLLGTEGNVIEQTRAFVSNRDTVNKGKEFNRLYSVEGAASLTGMNADYRLRLRTDAIEEFVLCLLSELVNKKKITSFVLSQKIIEILQKYDLSSFTKKHSLPENVISQLSEDLIKNKNRAVVSAGNLLPESTHIAVNLLNEAIGATELFSKVTENILQIPLSSKTDIEQLTVNMNSGRIGAVIHFDTNPVYHFSPDYNYPESLKKVPLTVTFTESQNETSVLSNYVLPSSHNLECWGDFKTRYGVISLQQPVISPLYQNRQKEAVLLTWIRGDKNSYTDKIYHDYILSYWEKNVYPSTGTLTDFKKFWYSALHDGVITYKEKSDPVPAFKEESFLNFSIKVKESSDFVVIFSESPYLGDGRFANNGWLQELPHPVSKIVWDNYAALSLQTASLLGIGSDNLVEINTGNKKQIIPAFIQPGMADNVIQLTMGYGRNQIGDVGKEVGVNINILLSKDNNLTERLCNKAKVSVASGSYELVSTQEHHAIDPPERIKDSHRKREIILEGTYSEYKKNPKFLEEGRHEVKLFNIAKDYRYTGYKWGMSIDLNKCTGCGVCVVACNAENNIPVVGKDQVKLGRELMWMRIDRYYSGSPDTPSMSFQPMLCQHCDNAPCENVCPVAATNHSPDGLNQMAYNRCVGTRYCSNNCPYKTRRFNFFDFRSYFRDAYYEQESISLLHNPEVTVRSRGVMEKCTFCVQRIIDERQHAIHDKREVNGENVKTACQQACPAYAIEFGDTSREDSIVTKYRKHDLSYNVLEEINVRPNVAYIARLRNIEKDTKGEKS